MPLIAVALVVGAAAAGFRVWSRAGADAEPSAALPARDATARNLLLVTIDTLRADRVGIYGHAAAKTPAIDALARSGVRFARAYAAAPITLPSHATLLTGRIPPTHGARHNGMRMHADVPTMATALAARGFATSAFVSAFPLDRRFGLDRGFGTYDDRLARRADGTLANERAGAVTVDAAIAWLAAHRAGRFFVWVHLFEPHAPYAAPGGSSPASTPPTARYDEEVTEADRQVGRLVDALGDRRASTLVVVTGDHGEAFGEHGEIGHSVFVYDTTLRVPLVLHGPTVPADGRVVEASVGLVDLASTLVGRLGESFPAGDGSDLGETLAGQGSVRASRALYAESFAPLLDFGWSPLRSLREGSLKLIAAPAPELFDVDSDAAEERNLAAARSDDARRLTAAVAKIAPADLAAPVAVDTEAAARLRSLGYVGAPRPVASGSRPDPKDRREIASRLAQVTSGEVTGDAMIALLEGVLRDDPGNPQAELRLGVALVERGECARAESLLTAAIRSGLPSADPFIPLAYCYRSRGDVAGARRTLTEALRVEPGNPVVGANLGLIAFDAGAMEEAIVRLRGALEADPDLHEARFVLVRALARSGQRDAARAEVATLLGRLPASAPQRAEVERLAAALR